MNAKEERAYVLGSRAVWRTILGEALRHLGSEAPDAARLVVEREDAVAALRSACEKYGDCDWEADAHLADVINKHLHSRMDDDDESERSAIYAIGVTPEEAAYTLGRARGWVRVMVRRDLSGDDCGGCEWGLEVFVVVRAGCDGVLMRVGGSHVPGGAALLYWEPVKEGS